jgi:hypothetical protein
MNYSGIAKNVLAALKSAGQQVLITHTTPSAYDPAAGYSAPTTASEFGYGAILLQSPKTPTDVVIPNTMVLAQERHLFLAASGLTFAPSLGDTITLATSETFTVVDLIVFTPAGVPLYYDLTLQ